MSANQIKVRRREVQKSNGKFFYILVIAALLVCLAVVALAMTSFGIFTPSAVITTENNRRVIRVPAGGDLQKAINEAAGGDIIELQAGATYGDAIVLPKKNIADFITIRSSQISKLAENSRVNPKDAALLAKIVTKGKEKPAVTAEAGAHHYRFVGIEFVPQTNDYTYNLVFLGEPEKLADVANHFEFDRCFFNSGDKGITRRGIAVNAADVVIKNSYFKGFAYAQQETQAICGWTGTKNVKILNNYLEGGAENILLGGADPKSADLIPTDIEIRGNHFKKEMSWKDKFTTKCQFEIKNARRVVFTGNYLENNPVGAAFRITVRNQDDTAPFSTIENVEISSNVISGAGDGVQILGTDDTYKSQKLRGLKIINNLFLNIGGGEYAGGGYFIQVSDGADILIANNTVFNQGNIISFYGAMPQNFLMRDNIVAHNDYGIHGFEPGIKTAAGQRIVRNNVFVNTKSIPNEYGAFPPNNFWVANFGAVGFLDLSGNNVRLAPNSRFKNKAESGGDIGFDPAKLPADFPVKSF